MKLRSDLVPHTDFHKGLWLLSEHSPWFFFLKTPRNFIIPKKKSFYETVDEDLLEIVKYLHSKGIPTTPSCSGHIKNPKIYKEIYNSLIDTEKVIKKDGIYLNNPETQRKFFYKNPNYKISMEKEEFMDEIQEYQKKGVLGFSDDGYVYSKVRNKIPSLHDNGKTFVFSKSNTTNEISDYWKKITKLISELF